MKRQEFGLQLDEATDSNKDAHLICYIWFVDVEKIVENLLFCKSITEGTKTQDFFEILDIFMCENNLDWTKCIGVCTDGGHSISGCYGGLPALIRSKALDVLYTHCITNRETLESNHLSSSLNLVLERKQHAHSETRRDGFNLQKKISTMEKRMNKDGSKDCFLL
ncbi:zinc finger MYM-type protein 6-like [Tachypleus tridentatus]|uniref:zinc finger MYM-type protein 6-like n=1 Tax=Tachypleus tridentatus TaxID=6853 RepID=UPI003FD0BB54